MVLIAIDKHSRKILGYLCRNNQNITYCCSECDVEFMRAKDLESHMVLHENPTKYDLPAAETIENEDNIDEDEVPQMAQSVIEIERQLQIKYQVTPCSVQLYRFEEFEPNVHHEENINQENVLPKKRPGPASSTQDSSITKKQKFGGQNSEKVLKKKSSLPCFLCGKMFNSSLSLEQHQKTHLESNNSTPVFPCNICGKSVKNMKMHLRQHKIIPKTYARKTTKAVNMIKPAEPTNLSHRAVKVDDTKVEEASSSTDAVLSNILKDKEPENGVTSNEDIETTLFENKSNESQTISQNMPPPNPVYCSSEELSTLVNPSYGQSLEVSESVPSQSAEEEAPVQQNGQPEISNDESLVKKAQMETIEPTTGEQTFNCSTCNRAFDSEARVIKHEALHENKVRCEICGKLVGGSYKKVHMKKYHRIDYPEINSQI